MERRSILLANVNIIPRESENGDGDYDDDDDDVRTMKTLKPLAAKLQILAQRNSSIPAHYLIFLVFVPFWYECVCNNNNNACVVRQQRERETEREKFICWTK